MQIELLVVVCLVEVAISPSIHTIALRGEDAYSQESYILATGMEETATTATIVKLRNAIVENVDCIQDKTYFQHLSFLLQVSLANFLA